MKRSPFAVRAVACAIALAPTALAAVPAGASAKHRRAHRALAGAATGTVTAASGSWFTIQTSGRRTGVVNAMVATADAITRGHYWYVWGGGHPMAGVPTRSGRTVGFDCSGSVAAVLAGAGLWAPGSGVPNDAGVIAQLRRDGLIAPGAGSGPAAVTLYDEPGVHIFMNIDGRFFGTSDGAGGTGPHEGAGWLYDGADDAHNLHFKQYHVLPFVLRDSTTYGRTLTFQAGTSAVAGVATGDRVRVAYSNGGAGEMVATAVGYPRATPLTGTIATLGSATFTLVGSTTPYTIAPTLTAPALAVGDGVALSYTASASGALLVRTLTVTAAAVLTDVSGTVTAVATDGSSLTVQAADGSTLALSTAGKAGLLGGVVAGDTVAVAYLTLGGAPVAEQVTVTAPPAAPAASAVPAAVAATGSGSPGADVSAPSSGSGPGGF